MTRKDKWDMKNQKGFVTSEFLISITIAFGLTMVTFGLTLTLSTAEVVQYIVYSAARAHSASSFDQGTQQEAARQKYRKLVQSPGLSSLLNGQWFEVGKPESLEIRSGNGDNFERDYGADGRRKYMQGVRTTFTANLLEMNLPMIGRVAEADGNGFTTRLNAMLMREVSHSECNQYMKDRADYLWTFGGGRFNRFKKQSATPWEDNGC